jgi:hypothetical protein
VTSVHAGKDNLVDMEPEARRIFTESGLSRDPNRLNVFLFVLDELGNVVHECHGVPGGRRGGPDRSDWGAEISKALAKLKLPDATLTRRDREPCRSLPDLAGPAADVPAGVRLFIRRDDANSSPRGGLPVVEIAPMKAEQWTPLAWSAKGKTISAELFKDWLVWLYPPAIRTADESQRFQQFRGSLQLEPAGADERLRYAILRGEIHLSKGDDTKSAFDGNLQAVLTYRRERPEVQSIQAVVEGIYLYRQRGTIPQKLIAAIESRPALSDGAPPVKRNASRPEESGPDSASQVTTVSSPDALNAEIVSLRASKVAWREIAWKPCLFDGLKESRERDKPVLLWIFIDRPADDARC